MKLMDIYSRLKKDMNIIEKQMEQSIYSENSVLRETSVHLLKAGGKRIRPVFVLLSGEFGQYNIEMMKKIAIPLELIHMATLVHDDVIDDADTRRGQLTVKSKWDNRIAMYTGDYIFAKALTIVTELPNPHIHQILSKAIVEMCIGEMEQIRFFFRTDQTVKDYLLRIKRKTALLIAISCQLGAVASEAKEEVSKSLFLYGYYIGMAFQIRDDILDLTGTEKQLGKPPGSDIKQGNVTLPVLLALRELDRREDMLRMIEQVKDTNGETNIEPLLKLIRSSQGMKLADQIAGRYIHKALYVLESLPDIRARKELVQISHFVGNRSY